MSARCSIACIIPPVLLQELARKGDDEQRDALLRTLSLDASLRTARVHNALVGAPANRTTVLQSVTPGQPQRTIYHCQGQEPTSSPGQVRAEGDPASGDDAVDEATTGWATPTPSTGTSSSATRSTIRACLCTVGCTTAATTTTPSGTARRWSSATARCFDRLTRSLT